MRAIDTPVTGFSVGCGDPDNNQAPVDNSAVSFLGHRSQDNAEQFAEAILADIPPVDPNDIGEMKHGGPIASFERGNSDQAQMSIVDDTKVV